MIATLGIIAMLSGFLVVLVFETTRPYIEANQREAIERAIFQVVPGASSKKEFVLTDTGVEPASNGAKGIPIYAAYDGEGMLAGIATEAAAPGYADVIRILYGYSPDCACITGISILQSKETPGLGDKIGTDPAFLANFEALDAKLNSEKTGLANAIVTVKHGTKSQPWEIDAISGATVSSKAIGRMLNESTQTLLPRLAGHWDELRD